MNRHTSTLELKADVQYSVGYHSYGEASKARIPLPHNYYANFLWPPDSDSSESSCLSSFCDFSLISGENSSSQWLLSECQCSVLLLGKFYFDPHFAFHYRKLPIRPWFLVPHFVVKMMPLSTTVRRSLGRVLDRIDGASQLRKVR